MEPREKSVCSDKSNVEIRSQTHCHAWSDVATYETHRQVMQWCVVVAIFWGKGRVGGDEGANGRGLPEIRQNQWQ